jgi:uncharacterized protein YbcI
MVAEPTRGQLERALGQRIQTLFRDRVGQRPSRAVCQMFDESLTIVLEETGLTAGAHFNGNWSGRTGKTIAIAAQ